MLEFFIMGETQIFFTALADRTRRRILNLMRDQEICVGYFTNILGVSQPKISRHLAYLRKAGIVSARRDGKWIYYRINEPEDFYAAQILQDTLKWFQADDKMQKDSKKLTMIFSSASIPATISRAPKPNKLPKTDINFERRKKSEELETFLL